MTFCAKNPSLIELHAALSSVHRTDGAPNRSAQGMLKEKAHYKNSELLGFSTLPQADDVRGAIFCKCIIDRKSNPVFKFNYSAKSMQTF